MPFALDEIRKFGQEGHEVFAADTFRTAPGAHSRHVTTRLVTVAPRKDPGAYVAQLAELITEHAIDLLVPTFEEVFYIGRHLEVVSERTRVFCAPLETLVQLHDKAKFHDLARSLGLRSPGTTVVSTREELRQALDEHPRYFARPAFSRGGVKLLTNAGPLAGRVAIESCQPTPQNPWLVQEFVTGEDVCTFSVAHEGRVTAHVSYVHPHTTGHAGGISFLSVDAPETLEITRTLVQALGYTGQMALDFLRTDQGLTLVECNPRATAGVALLSSGDFVDAVLDRPPGETRVAPAGEKRHIAMGLVREMVHSWKEIPSNLKELFSGTRDIYREPGDAVPALYQLISSAHLMIKHGYEARLDDKRGLLGAMFNDILWDGAPIP